MHPFTIMALVGLGLFILTLIIGFSPDWFHISLNPVKIPATAVCICHGHRWHEGDDTLHTLAGSKGGGFHWGTFTWRCLRCGVQTEPGEPPPPNQSWDHTWVNPMDEPRWWVNEKEPGDCADIYRRRQDRVEEIKRRWKMDDERSSEPSAE